MRALFRSKYRVLTLISLAFMTQCCCIVVPFSVEAQRQQAAAAQQAAARQQETAQQQAAVPQPFVQQVVERIEAVVAFDR